MSWEEVDKLLNETLTAIIACKKAALEAQKYAAQAQIHKEECQYWADKLRKKKLLFEEG